MARCNFTFKPTGISKIDFALEMMANDMDRRTARYMLQGFRWGYEASSDYDLDIGWMLGEIWFELLDNPEPIDDEEA